MMSVKFSLLNDVPLEFEQLADMQELQVAVSQLRKKWLQVAN